jgi:hypothetical protein
MHMHRRTRRYIPGMLYGWHIHEERTHTLNHTPPLSAAPSPSAGRKATRHCGLSTKVSKSEQPPDGAQHPVTRRSHSPAASGRHTCSRLTARAGNRRFGW